MDIHAVRNHVVDVLIPSTEGLTLENGPVTATEKQTESSIPKPSNVEVDSTKKCIATSSSKVKVELPGQTSTKSVDGQVQAKPRHIWATKGENPSFRQIYPNYFFSPFTSPASSPSARRRNLKESQRISVEKLGDHIQLNQYKLKERIGQGSYGIVKLAYNEEDEKHYAMKIFSKKKLIQQAGLLSRRPGRRDCSEGASSSESPLTRAYREIAILKKLDHPNVVDLVEVLDDPAEDNLYLVFELLERGEVLQIPSQDPLKEDVARLYFRDVVLGLEYLHYQKIIHRDIKPSNLLVSDENRIKIADFGICNEFRGDDDSLRTITYGTPAFMAPEVISSPSGTYSGKAADIWQLGVTLYALVFGRVPFSDTNVVSLYTKIQVEDFTFPKKPVVSSSLKDLISKMLLKDPTKRILLKDIKSHEWVTAGGKELLPSEEENCKQYIYVTEDEVLCCVQSIPKLDTLILVKTMLKHHSFHHPFKKNSYDMSTPHLQERSLSAPSSCDYLHVKNVKSTFLPE